MWKMCAYNQTQSKWTHQLNSREGNIWSMRMNILDTRYCMFAYESGKEIKEEREGGGGEDLERKKAYAERCVYFDIHFMDVDSRHFNNR